MRPSSTPLRRALCAGLASALLLAAPLSARAADASAAASALSALPVAVVVAAPVALLAGGAQLSVVAVEASAEGTVWVMQRGSDGARASLRLAGQAAGGASVAAGTVVTVTALGSGLLLSAAGQALAFVPNAVGLALMHNERVSQ
ncbi:hypothetical protein [Pseudaquabacterium pictum]|uniref:Uncharacterized protein n=1 Tax=Pseudaquabacterium pictum TaxID=2315236 RepID=A0A480AS96_9BURK|nr:hypothetical protein [Rubrivivax pictus]GCL64529.1 hypothetical protein AQPW35_36100 [Rubrivivax pictus]